METSLCEWTTAFALPCKHLLLCEWSQSSSREGLMWREVLATLLETDAKKRPLVPGYNLKRVFKAFRYGVVHLSHLQMIINPLFQLSRSVGCALPDRLCSQVKVHENNL